ncbi:MAG: asparagine synthase (glutamine-hydrolyzing) [Rhodospirillales bacterium]|nr:asparagine synthase (glutamine-hydrolyzing) [Alphaproteobacteria bacterium]MCB9987489.1 asparagine synthase (glutamine-hydrolyzing) [Rhodospirillales bacterium]USO07536.1 MAG: asparagine synthase (glutamine-hydrolyzing) [Rhodospirillales bacterium]
MCGIGGFIAHAGNAPQKPALAAMRDALATRGPDGNGMAVNDAVGLVHTRLSIIDLAGGAQPIADYKGRVLVFNGEIYNYRELRAALSGRYTFRTNSDSETILAAYDAHGVDCVHHLRGMYAFAIYDPGAGRTLLARDPFGIKPLYLAETAAGIAFASEPKALVAGGFAAPDIDVMRLRAVLRHNFIGGTLTPYPAIARMQPGESRLYEHGKLVSSSIRSFLALQPARADDRAEALLELNDILCDSVDLHCRSDVGYGVFLSGGVDSSAIMAALALRGDVAQIRTYTAYFDVPGAGDERDYARAVRESVGAQGVDVLFDAADFDAMLPAIAAYMDDPVTDYAILPTWKLASVAAREQKVVLSGEGGDELFAGYGRYRSRPWKDWRRWFAQDGVDLPRAWSRLQRLQARDIAGYLPCDLLVKLDTCLMAHGLEGRTPFLDERVAEFAFGLPDALKLRGRDGKYLLRHWLDGALPQARAFERKRGFTVPVGGWIADMARDLADFLPRQPVLRELLTAREMAALTARLHTPEGAKAAWGPLYLALWHAGKTSAAPAPSIREALAIT